MTPATLSEIGFLLWGARWRLEMSEALMVSRVTINRWASGRCRTPSYLPLRLACLAVEARRDAERAEQLARQAGGK